MTNVDWLDEYSEHDVNPFLPEDLPYWLSPIVCTIPGQILALQIALERGLDSGPAAQAEQDYFDLLTSGPQDFFCCFQETNRKNFSWEVLTCPTN